MAFFYFHCSKNDVGNSIVLKAIFLNNYVKDIFEK